MDRLAEFQSPNLTNLDWRMAGIWERTIVLGVPLALESSQLRWIMACLPRIAQALQVMPVAHSATPLLPPGSPPLSIRCSCPLGAWRGGIAGLAEGSILMTAG